METEGKRLTLERNRMYGGSTEMASTMERNICFV